MLDQNRPIENDLDRDPLPVESKLRSGSMMSAVAREMLWAPYYNWNTDPLWFPSSCCWLWRCVERGWRLWSPGGLPSQYMNLSPKKKSEKNEALGAPTCKNNCNSVW